MKGGGEGTGWKGAVRGHVKNREERKGESSLFLTEILTNKRMATLKHCPSWKTLLFKLISQHSENIAKGYGTSTKVFGRIYYK